jgi:hypothetical protein
MNMRKTTILSLFLLLAVSTAFAHAGHEHVYMGTVSMLHGDAAFMITTTDGRSVTVQTTEATVYSDADGHAVKRTDVAVGKRVVVKMMTDGKTASSVKLAK